MKLLNSLFLICTLFIFIRCDKGEKFSEDFNKYPDRIWINENFWSIPLEDWKLDEKRVECTGNIGNMRLNLLTYQTKGYGDYTFSARMGIAGEYKKNGTVGFRIGITDNTDKDIRSLCYFGKGIEVGINTGGFIFIGDNPKELPKGYTLEDFQLTVKVSNSKEENEIQLIFKNKSGIQTTINQKNAGNTEGILQLVNNFKTQGNYSKGAKFWFDDIALSGSMVRKSKNNSFGPVLWAMYTLNQGTLKITAQMPPLGEKDDQKVAFQIKQDNNWKTLQENKIKPQARIASFTITDWKSTQDIPYRLVYKEKYRKGSSKKHYYEGTIRKEPKNGKLEVGGMTCQYHYGFPYRPLVDNLKQKNPDLLYFSGDQIYEANGGYGIIRRPADRAILNYLGKWYMFGWAFGDLMRDRPTICIPDDHEVYQGNLWGEGGNSLTLDEWRENRDCIGGFVQPADMVNVVVHTNCSHLPEPFDSTPMKQNIDVYYTGMTYGGVSFGIIGDRIFKSGPEAVSFWEGRKDHLKQKLKDPSILDSDTLKLLGDRQMKFLKHWIEDWEKAEMKVLLSQTLFANTATHHGSNKMFLVGDLDSGGWPKSARDNTLNLIRKCFAFHICGDQHLPSLVHYGIDECRDAGWVFCTPAIAVGYQRFFLPDKLGWPVYKRPEHGNPNTGCYTDAFGNINYIYAVGNPADKNTHTNRYKMAELKSSGFGYITFDLDQRKIQSEAYRFMANLTDGVQADDQFPGWPKTIDQTDNYTKDAVAYLPTIQLKNQTEALIKITEEKTGKLVYIIRMKDNTFMPKVFRKGAYTIEIKKGDKRKELRDIETINEKDAKVLEVAF